MRRTVTITNKTDFDSRNLRSMILAVARRHLKPTEYKTMRVTIGYPKRSYVTGKATINGHPISSTAVFSVFIPKDHTDPLEVCERIKKCLDYCYGRMGGTKGTEYSDWHQYKGKAVNHPYAAKMTLTKAATKVKTKLVGAGAALKKAEFAQDKVNFWEAKLKKAETMLKKWKGKLRYHETRGEKLHKVEAEALQNQQGMTVEEFLKLPPVNEQGQ